MAVLWPWLAIAGLGALHGLSPANGWMLAAACGVHARDETLARRALSPIACGQVASMGLLAWAVSQGLSVDRALMRDLAVALLVAAASWLAVRGAPAPARIDARARSAGLALWSFLIATAQGAGLMLVPALMPRCAGSAAPSALTVPGSSPLVLAVAALAVHTAAMLLVTGLLATGACRGVRMIGLLLRDPLAATQRSRDAAAADCKSATSLAKALSTQGGSVSTRASTANESDSHSPSRSCGAARERRGFVVARVAIRRFDSAITASRVSGVM